MAGKKQPQASKNPAGFNMDKRGRHFSKVSIINFRCFKDFSIDSLERINLIGGKNNVGKTAFLEALFLLLGTTNARVILTINAIRGIEKYEGDVSLIKETLWSHLFNNAYDSTAISITGELAINKLLSVIIEQSYGVSTTLQIGEPVQNQYLLHPTDSSITLPTGTTSQELISQGKTSSGYRALKLTYHIPSGKNHSITLQVDANGIHIPPQILNPIFPHSFLSARYRSTQQELAKRYGQLEIQESHYDLLGALQIIEPKLKKISTIIGASGSMIYGDIGIGRMLPLSMMGEGLTGLTSILLAIASASEGIVLIDEIENGLHYSVLVKVWQAISEAARRYNTQVFATTHSWECITAAHEAFQHAEPYDFCFHRFQESNGSIEAISFDKDTLQTTIESGWEIR